MGESASHALIDSHCHLDLPEFDQDIDDVINRATNEGVVRFLVPGTSIKGWSRQCALAAQYPQVDIALGIHPWFIDKQQRPEETVLEQMLADAPEALVAVGEMGLDAAIDMAMEQQISWFERQLHIARDAHLPVIVHHRRSHHLILQSIKRTKFLHGGVIHAFSGSRELAEQYIQAGFMLGIGGTITYERAQKTRDTVTALPLASLLLETDAPSMPMCGRQGQRNEPGFLPTVASALAELQSCSLQDVCEQTSQNYLRCFKYN